MTELRQVSAEHLAAGLSNNEVLFKTKEGMVNIPYKAKTKTLAEIVKDNTFTIFNILNIFFALLIVILALRNFSAIVNITFMGLVVFNTVIGIYQEIKAKYVLDKLSLAVQSSIQVIRNNDTFFIKDTELVTDDLCLVTTGQIFNFDAIVVDEWGLEVDESILTGESNSVLKKEKECIYSGSQIIAGEAIVRVKNVGENTYMAKLEKSLLKSGKEKSQIMVSLNKIVRFLSFFLIPLGFCLFISQYFWGGRIVGRGVFAIDNLILSTIAALVGMIPEGLILLTSISFMVSVTRLGTKYDMLVQTLPAVETLARVNVLCLDKTGTLTTGNIKYEGLVDLTVQLSEKSPYTLSRRFQNDLHKALLSSVIAKSSQNATQLALEREFLTKENLQETSQQESLLNGSISSTTSLSNPTFFAEGSSVRDTYELKKMIPFQSIRKWAAFNFKEEPEKSYLLGAPSYILKDEPTLYEQISDKLAYFTNQGYRCLLFACKDSAISEENSFIKENAKTEPLAIVVLSDEVRAQAEETLRYFYDQDVNTVIISGDDPKTVVSLAKRVGFFNLDVAQKQPNSDFSRENMSLYLDCSTFTVDSVSLDQLVEYVKRYRVFGRVSPELKKMLIRAFQYKGDFVAMVGDGVNDVPALKEADCSVALANGASAASAISDFVLLSNNLQSLIPSVYEGRRVIHNIENVSTLFLNKTIYSSILAILFLFLPIRYPLIPIQITLLSTFTIGVPSFFLALSPNKKRVKNKFLQRILYASAPTAVGIVLALLVHFSLSFYLHLPLWQVQQISTLMIGIGGFFLLWQTMRPFSIAKSILFAFCLISFLGFGYFLPRILHLQILSYLFSSIFLQIYILGISSVVLFFIYTAQKLQGKYHFQKYLNRWRW